MRSWARFWLPEDKTGYSWISCSWFETNWVPKTPDKKLVRLGKQFTSNSRKRNERPTNRPNHTKKLGQSEDVKLATSRIKTSFFHFSNFFETRNFCVNNWCPSRTFFSEKVIFVNNWCRQQLVPGGVYYKHCKYLQVPYVDTIHSDFERFFCQLWLLRNKVFFAEQ